MTVRTTQQQPKYGDGDASFRAAGGVVGLRKLVNDFYDITVSYTHLTLPTILRV